jgi:DNA primase
VDRAEIYTRIVDAAVLSQFHREEIKSKRGFSDDVIDKFKFRSAGPYLQNDARLARIPEDVSASLFYDNILIPYFDPEGNIVHLRPHKFGFKGAGIQPYIPYPLLTSEAQNHIVIAESEFKAIASCLLGVPAIGVPGISSFAKSHLEDLVKILEALKCRNVTICFDNEVKDDPSFPNFKPDYTNRYDVEIYSFIMAYSLRAKGFNANVAKLKDAWRINGKADIDGILAKGISPDDYQARIAAAVSPQEWRQSWTMPAMHRPYVDRRIDRFYYSGAIEKEFKHYVLKTKSGTKKLTNFTIQIIHTLQSKCGAERLCSFKNQYGSTNQVIIKPDVMVSRAVFQKFCYELGDFEYYGSDTDLSTLWNYVILHQDGRSVRKLDYFGYDDSTGIWFFHNAAYRLGNFYVADEEGIVWINDSGFLLPKLENDSGTKEQEGLVVPSLDATEKKITSEEICERFSKVFHAQYSRIILGWTLGNFFMPEILKDFKVYPFLFFYGKQQSGKSTLAKWVSSFFGFNQQGIPYLTSSAVGISRMAAKLSMIPIWLEEYRNKDMNLSGKNNLLRSIYDKSTVVKGTKREDEIKTYRSRSTIMISGEEYPQDAALNSRCLLIPVYRHNYANTEDYYWMLHNAPLFNQIGHHIMVNRQALWPEVRKRILEYQGVFEKELEDSDSRSRLHYAIIAGVADVFFGRSKEFETFLAETIMDRTTLVDKSQAINVFLEDLVAMSGTGKMGGVQIVRRVLTTEDGKKVRRVAFWLTGAYSLWEVQFKGQRNEIPATKQALIEHIKSEGYFICSKHARINDKIQNCLLLNEDHADFPIQLQMILASDDAELLNAPWKPDTYENLNEIERPVDHSKLAFGDNVLSMGARRGDGSSPVGQKSISDIKPEGEVGPY